MGDNNGDSTPLLNQSSARESLDNEAIVDTRVPYKYQYHSLKPLRYGTFVRIILFVDAVSAIGLWASGGNKKYFVDNILHFHFLESVFDLALISTVKVISMFILYYALEDSTEKELDEPYSSPARRKKFTLHVVIIVLSLMYFTYPVVKGSLVLDAFLNSTDYEKMHLPYNILLITTVSFSLLELVLALCSFSAMRRLKLERVLHRLDENKRELDAEGKVITKDVNLWRLASLVKSELRLILVGCLCLLGSTASTVASPLFFGIVVDAAQRSMSELNRAVVILLLINIAGAVVGAGRSWLFTLAGQRMVARLRKELYIAIIAQDIAFFDVNRTGELTNRLASDTQVLQNAVTVNVSMLVRYSLQIIGALVFMFVLNPSLTGVLLAIVPIVSLSAVQYGKFVQRARKAFQDCLAEASTTAEESISSVRTVRSFAGETKAIALYSESVDKSYAQGRRLAVAFGSFEGFIGLAIAGAVALVLWYGGKLVFEKQLTPGVLTSFLLYTMNVAFAFGLLSSVYGDFMQAVGASVRIFELFDKKPDIPNEGGEQLESLDQGIEFQDVQFTYPSRPDNKVLKSVSFRVDKGQMVALVGPSGGGKSTIISLIERFYDPDSGSIKLGGSDLRDLDPKWFRQHISTVSQEPTLFACSIKDNITYGRDAPMSEIETVARQANAHNFIETFEDKYETLVGERGVRLSGGQKQRVAIARALILNPDILLLDEATSALDAESEHLVQEAIDRAMTNRTVLVIAHRLSTVRDADKVIVIDKGEIAEQGTHDDLLWKDGVYKRLVLRQLTAGDQSLGANGKQENAPEGANSEQEDHGTLGDNDKQEGIVTLAENSQ